MRPQAVAKWVYIQSFRWMSTAGILLMASIGGYYLCNRDYPDVRLAVMPLA